MRMHGALQGNGRNRWWIGAAALAAALLGGGAQAAAGAGDEPRTKLRLILDRDGAKDRLEVDDLGDLAVGESRSYSTERGATVVASRDEEGLELELDGRKIRVHDGGRIHGDGDVVGWREKRIEVGDDPGDGKTMVVLSSDQEVDGDVRIVRHLGGDGHAFVFGHGPHGLPFGVEATIERLEANARFQGLDAATRATVLEALRESAPRPTIERLGEPGEAGPGERVIVLDVREQRDPAAD
jgi:hypothetical protein